MARRTSASTAPAATAVVPRVPLQRERVLRAAIDLADERGLGALTMRRLAEALGVEAEGRDGNVTRMPFVDRAGLSERCAPDP